MTWTLTVTHPTACNAVISAACSTCPSSASSRTIATALPPLPPLPRATVGLGKLTAGGKAPRAVVPISDEGVGAAGAPGDNGDANAGKAVGAWPAPLPVVPGVATPLAAVRMSGSLPAASAVLSDDVALSDDDDDDGDDGDDESGEANGDVATGNGVAAPLGCASTPASLLTAGTATLMAHASAGASTVIKEGVGNDTSDPPSGCFTALTCASSGALVIPGSGAVAPGGGTGVPGGEEGSLVGTCCVFTTAAATSLVVADSDGVAEVPAFLTGGSDTPFDATSEVSVGSGGAGGEVLAL